MCLRQGRKSIVPETNWSIPSALDAVAVVENSQVVGYNLAYSPAAAQYLGEQLAGLARASDATLIASWRDADDSVLAHIASVQLGIGRVVIELDLGLLDISPHPTLALRTVLIGTAFGRSPIGPIAELLEDAGHSLVAAISLVPFAAGTDVPAGLHTNSLV